MPAPAKVTEDAYAEQPALEWLEEVGWQDINGPTLAPGDAERTLDSDVVLQETFRSAVARLNPDLPPEAVVRATELALTSTQASLIADHQDFHELLLAGVPVTWIDDEHGERSTRARLIDWDVPDNNRFQAVNQLTIVEGGANRRPDVLLYVNGLPLGQLELKNPSLDEDGPTKAVNQDRHYRRTIPGLYRYVEVIGVSDLLRARVGTITTQAEHFAEWKTMDPAGMQGRSQLEVLITEVFTPAGLLDLIRNFVLFETDGARTWNVMAKYHQVDAVNRAVAATHEAMADRSRRAGVVWHTQGAGKSYSMVFFATKLRRDRRFANPTIVCVTDTNDLDNQLSETFARQAHLAPVVRQADRIQGGPDSLYALLDVPADGIVFTTIQKFARREEERRPGGQRDPRRLRHGRRRAARDQRALRRLPRRRGQQAHPSRRCWRATRPSRSPAPRSSRSWSTSLATCAPRPAATSSSASRGRRPRSTTRSPPGARRSSTTRA